MELGCRCLPNPFQHILEPVHVVYAVEITGMEQRIPP